MQYTISVCKWIRFVLPKTQNRRRLSAAPAPSPPAPSPNPRSLPRPPPVPSPPRRPRAPSARTRLQASPLPRRSCPRRRCSKPPARARLLRGLRGEIPAARRDGVRARPAHDAAVRHLFRLFRHPSLLCRQDRHGHTVAAHRRVRLFLAFLFGVRPLVPGCRLFRRLAGKLKIAAVVWRPRNCLLLFKNYSGFTRKALFAIVPLQPPPNRISHPFRSRTFMICSIRVCARRVRRGCGKPKKNRRAVAERTKLYKKHGIFSHLSFFFHCFWT